MNTIDLLYQKIETAGCWERTMTIGRNAFLTREGSTDTNLYYVVAGSLRVFLPHPAGEHTIRFGYGHNFIAALDSFITEKPTRLCIQALKQTELRVITKKSYTALMNRTPENSALWNTILEQLVVEQMEREQDILIASPAERYQRVLQRSPQLFQEIPHKYIAAYLRMTPETLSRMKRR